MCCKANDCSKPLTTSEKAARHDAPHVTRSERRRFAPARVCRNDGAWLQGWRATTKRGTCGKCRCVINTFGGHGRVVSPPNRPLSTPGSSRILKLTSHSTLATAIAQHAQLLRAGPFAS